MNQSIIIQQVSNGWLVMLPDIPKANMLDDPEMFINAAKQMNKEMNSDPLLNELRSNNELKKKPLLSDLKDDNTAVFKTFDEVLSFLKYKMTE